MKAYPLLYLSLFSFVTILACKPPRTTQAEKMKEMEKKELKMLEDSQPKSEEEAIDQLGTHRYRHLLLSLHPKHRKGIRHHRHLRRQMSAHLFMEHGRRRNHDLLGQSHPV